MAVPVKKILRALRYRLVDGPRGFGKPVAEAVADAEYREGHWDHFFHWDELPRHLVLAGAIAHFCPQPSVLDLGCGSGRLADIFRVHPRTRYVGVDFSAEGLARARALDLEGIEWVQADYSAWQPDGQFDAIVFNESLGYARDVAALLQGFAPRLSGRGRFFVSHFRFGHHAAVWRRVDTVCETLAGTTVMSAEGRRAWDIRVLKPRKAGAANV